MFFKKIFYGSDLSFTRKGCTASQIIHTNGTAFIIIVGPDDTSEILNTDDIFGKWLRGEISLIHNIANLTNTKKFIIGPTLPHACRFGSLVHS